MIPCYADIDNRKFETLHADVYIKEASIALDAVLAPPKQVVFEKGNQAIIINAYGVTFTGKRNGSMWVSYHQVRKAFDNARI